MNELENLLKSRSGDLHQWSLFRNETHREEHYLIQDRKAIVSLDQNRSVRDEQVWLGVWVTKENAKQDKRIGFARALVDLKENLGAQVDALIKKAHLTDEQFWKFLVPTPLLSVAPGPKLCFDGFLKDLELGSQYFVDNCMEEIRKTAGASFNSAEIFISRQKEERRLSSGFSATEVKSKIYSEVCFSAEDDRDSNEFLVTRVGLHPDQIQFKSVCERSVAGAQALLRAEPMPSGKYLVKLDAETLGQLFNDASQWLRAERQYYRLPFLKAGDQLVPDFKGANFELILDPTIHFGLGSSRFDEYGSPESRLCLVQDNRVTANIVDGRIAQYLNLSANGNSGNLVVKPRTTISSEKLSKLDHLDIWQFSGLFSDPQSLTFSSEVRLAEMVRSNGKRFFVKGGNLSGKFQENFSEIRFSDGRTFVNLNDQAIGASLGFEGPTWGLLNDVSVSS